MSTINEHKESKETVTMTVVIPKSSRDKLGRVKGIYGCDSLACTVSSVIEDIVIPDLLRSVADREVVTHGLTQDDTIVTHESLMTDNTETQEKVAFCNGLIIEFMLEDMADLKQRMYDGKLKMIRTDNGDPNEWEE